MKLFNVYEKRGDSDRSFINSVFAENTESAKKKALEAFGSPIEVEVA